MAIIKIYLEAESVITGTVTITTAASIVPTIDRFTATVVLGDVVGGVTTIPAQNFTNDNGTSVPVGGLTVPTSSGYYNVFVNGILQRGGLSTLSSTSLIINTALLIGATVVIEVINIIVTATSTSTNSLSVTTIID